MDTRIIKVNVAGHFIYCDHVSFGDSEFRLLVKRGDGNGYKTIYQGKMSDLRGISIEMLNF